jgi:hypothetical protein
MSAPQITDTSNVPISYLRFSQVESADSAVFVVRVPCVAGQALKAEDNADVRVLGRRHGTADAFVDLASNPISLTPFAGTNTDFDLKLHTNAVAGIVSTAIELRATFNA